MNFRLDESALASIDSSNYDLGRADERVAVDALLEALEQRLVRGQDMVHHDDLIDRIRKYRADTAKVVAAGRARGWYPT